LQETILITYDLLLEYNNPLYRKCKEGYLVYNLIDISIVYSYKKLYKNRLYLSNN